MYCNHCRKEIPDGSQFCVHCGSSTASKTSSPAPTQEKKNSMGKRILWGLVAVVVAVTARNIGYNMASGGTKTNTSNYSVSQSKNTQKKSSNEFQMLTDKYGISLYFIEPYTADGEKSASYLRYYDNDNVPFVEEISIVYKKGTDTVTSVTYNYYYLLESLNYTDEQCQAFKESATATFEESYNSEYASVSGIYYPTNHVCKITAFLHGLQYDFIQNDLTSKGILDCTGGISYKLSDQDFLASGYVKK